MRFIWNFFFFGILFYLIWMFFPDAFMTLVGWANHVVEFFRELFTSGWEKFQHNVPAPSKETPASSMLILPFLSWLKAFSRR